MNKKRPALKEPDEKTKYSHLSDDEFQEIDFSSLNESDQTEYIVEDCVRNSKKIIKRVNAMTDEEFRQYRLEHFSS